MWLNGRVPAEIPISDARNLGPKSAELLRAAKIKSLGDLINFGWRDCYEKIVRKNPKTLMLVMLNYH